MKITLFLFYVSSTLVCRALAVNFLITAKFIFGDVLFVWNGSSPEGYNVSISTDTTHRQWVHVNDSQCTVKDALLYKSIDINVYLLNGQKYGDATYKVDILPSRPGSTITLSWSTTFFPFAGTYNIYHTNDVNKSIIQVTSREVKTSEEKYRYLSRPYNSTKISFEIRDITLEDAGYYAGGVTSEAAFLGGGRVLIMKEKPIKPNIGGYLTILEDSYMELYCSSEHISAPEYYTKLYPLYYMWFVNGSQLQEKSEKTLRFRATRQHHYNHYSCVAVDTLESDMSDAVQINVLRRNLPITAKFMFGDVVFIWNGTSPEGYNVSIPTDTTHRQWIHVNDSRCTLQKALLYESISISVYLLNGQKYGDATYKVDYVVSQPGKTIALFWSVPFFPIDEIYTIYHTNIINKTIIQVTSKEVRESPSEKYGYLSHPYNSTNILFEIRDITLEDAGYYAGGVTSEAAFLGGGRIIIVEEKPTKPKIGGNLTISGDSDIELYCSSKQMSAPQYYANLYPLYYMWFVNGSQLQEKSEKTLRFRTTRQHRYNQYSCVAVDILESDMSDAVQINVLSGNLPIKGKFMFGDVVFIWNGTSPEGYNVSIPTDTTHRQWIHVNDSRCTVQKALLYESISISVYLLNGQKYGDATYKVDYVVSQLGITKTVSWSVAFFPITGIYTIYHTNIINKTIIQVTSKEVKVLRPEKYRYLSHQYDLTNITFEIRDITLEDAGYYAGDVTSEAAFFGGGRILIVKEKPTKPKIWGNLTILEDSYIELYCSSEHISAPEYYTKLYPLYYMWFVNGSQLQEKSNETLRFRVNRQHRYNQYACLSVDTLESDMSDTVQINVLKKLRLDTSYPVKTNYVFVSGRDVIVIVDILVLANAAPEESDIAWFGPSGNPEIKTTVLNHDDTSKYWIRGRMSIIDQRSFGQYTLRYHKKEIINITINVPEGLLV